MKTGKRIPISSLKALAQTYGYSHIVALAFDKNTGTESVATWGETVEDCEVAAHGGNLVKKTLGWPEKLVDAKPARQKEREKKIREMVRQEIYDGLLALQKERYVGLNTIDERDIKEYFESYKRK